MAPGGWTLSERGRSMMGAVLSVAVWLFIAVPAAVQSVGAPKYRQVVGAPNPTMIHSAAVLQQFLLAVLAAVCFAAVMVSMPGVRLVRGLRFTVMLAPWVYLVAHDYWVGYGPSLGSLLYPLVVVAVYFLQPPIASLRVVAHLTAFTAVVSMAMAMLWPSSAIYSDAIGGEIAADKQILPWGFLEGFLTQPNNLGQLLLLGMPTVLLLRSRSLRYLYAALVGLALVWTGSRSSIYTTLICLLAALVCVAARNASAATRRAIGVWWGVVMSVVMVSLPLVATDPAAFSNRGYIWMLSLDAWASSPWLGLGSKWYGMLAATSANVGGSVFHGHNQFVQWLVTGGIVLVILVTFMIVALTRAAARAGVFGVVYVAALLGSCWLEVSIRFVEESPFIGVVAVPIAVLLFAPDRHASVAAGDVSAAQDASALRPVDGRVPVAAGNRLAREPQHKRRVRSDARGQRNDSRDIDHGGPHPKDKLEHGV